MKYHQRDIVEVSFLFPDGTFKPHPAIIVSNVTLPNKMTLGGGYSMMTGTWYVTYIFLPSPFKHLPSDFRCHSPVPVTFRKGKEKLKVE